MLLPRRLSLSYSAWDPLFSLYGNTVSTHPLILNHTKFTIKINETSN